MATNLTTCSAYQIADRRVWVGRVLVLAYIAVVAVSLLPSFTSSFSSLDEHRSSGSLTYTTAFVSLIAFALGDLSTY